MRRKSQSSTNDLEQPRLKLYRIEVICERDVKTKIKNEGRRGLNGQDRATSIWLRLMWLKEALSARHFSISKRLRILGVIFFPQLFQRSIFNSVKLNNNVFKLFKNNKNCFVCLCDHNEVTKYFKNQFLIEMIKFDSLNSAKFKVRVRFVK